MGTTYPVIEDPVSTVPEGDSRKVQHTWPDAINASELARRQPSSFHISGKSEDWISGNPDLSRVTSPANCLLFEDFGYWYTQGVLQPDGIIDAIVAIDKNTDENGCMRLMRHSHKLGWLFLWKVL